MCSLMNLFDKFFFEVSSLVFFFGQIRPVSSVGSMSDCRGSQEFRGCRCSSPAGPTYLHTFMEFGHEILSMAIPSSTAVSSKVVVRHLLRFVLSTGLKLRCRDLNLARDSE
ncbi:hypothetical protein ACF0H5_013446 [Mactra antiquata]